MIGYFVRHPNASNLMMVAAVACGLSVLPQMEREAFPEFTPSRVAVNVIYPGASAIDVDADICQELDGALDAVVNLDEIDCRAVEGRATATLTMVDGGDLGQFYNDILSDVSAINYLPDDAEAPTVAIQGQNEEVALLAVTGIADRQSLIRYADTLAARLSGLRVVADARVAGISEIEVQVQLDPLLLRRHGLSARDVADAVKARSLLQPLGIARTDTQELVLRYGDVRRGADTLADLIVVDTPGGGFVRVGDLGTVRLGEADPELRSLLNGDEAAVIHIEKTKDGDAIEAFDAVARVIAQEKARLPHPFSITVARDQTENISERLNLILANTGIGLALVLGVMVLYFSFGSAFWIAAALPVTFCASFFVLAALGVTINMISLIGLLMAVGLIMDDSIVIADNIAKWRRTHPPTEAAVRGTLEVMPGVFASFITTACVFAPLMFLSGEMGQILQVIPLVLLVTLSLGLVEAFLILPNHLAHTASDPDKEANRVIPKVTEAVRERVVLPTVRVFVSWRYLAVGLTFSALIATAGLVSSGFVKVVGFPTIESDTIEARIALTPGTPLWRTEELSRRLVAALDRVDAQFAPGTDGGAALVEQLLLRFATNRDAPSNGPHTLTITADLLESGRRNVAADDVLNAWREEVGPITDLAQASFQQTSMAPGGPDLDLEVRGRDLDAVEAAAAALQRRLIVRPDVTEARVDFVRGLGSVVFVLNEAGIASGLTPQSLAAQLRGAFTGTETDTFTTDFSDLSVRVELGEQVSSLAELEDFPVVLPGGDLAALATVADLTRTLAFDQITRKSGFVVAKIEGQIDRTRTTATELAQYVTDAAAPDLALEYPGITVAVGGASEAMAETQASILSAFLLGLIGVYLVLAFLFRSYTMPLVAMLSIPFTFIGMILGHILIGVDVAMPSFVGFASLAGIVVNNAILFVTFFEQSVRERSVEEAVVDAVSQRFRAVFLSFSTTFLGLMPIVFETSVHAQTMVPLVTAVAFGLLSSTVLSIFVLPAALTIYFDFFDVERWRAKRGAQTGERVALTGPAATLPR